MAKKIPKRLRKHDYRTKESRVQRVIHGLLLLRGDMEHKFTEWNKELERLQALLDPKLRKAMKDDRR